MTGIEFLERFLFPVDLPRDYWVDDEVKRGSSRSMLLSKSGFKDWYLKRKDLGRCWVSVCYYGDDYKPKYFDRVVYDFDIPLTKNNCQKLREEDRKLFRSWLNFVKTEVCRFYHFIAKRYNTTPVLIYTGNRGYQVHILLDRLIEAEHYTMVFNILRTGFVERKNPDWLVKRTRSIFGDFEPESVIDWHVSDNARMLRVPYTRHEAGGVCTIIDPNTLKPMKADRAIKLLGSPITANWIERIVGIGVEFEKTRRIKLLKEERRGKRYSIEELLEHHSPPCIKAIWEKFKAHIEVDHNSRLVLLWYLMNKGYSKEEIIEIFKMLPDYDEEITKYQVDYAFRKGYKMPSCKKRKEWGVCVGDCKNINSTCNRGEECSVDVNFPKLVCGECAHYDAEWMYCRKRNLHVLSSIDPRARLCPFFKLKVEEGVDSG